jgi:hypothetical protein
MSWDCDWRYTFKLKKVDQPANSEELNPVEYLLPGPRNPEQKGCIFKS